MVIFNTKIIKSTKIIITIITHIIVVIIVTWFCTTRKNVVFDVQKKLYNLPELGGGGGEVIWEMPERNRFFLWEVFPNMDCCYVFSFAYSCQHLKWNLLKKSDVTFMGSVIVRSRHCLVHLMI